MDLLFLDDRLETFSSMDWPSQSPNINTNENPLDVLEKIRGSGQIVPYSIQDFGEKFLQHCSEMNLVALQNCKQN